MKKIRTPLDINQINKLNSGDALFLSGTIYTARDQVHKRLQDAINRNIRLPINLKNEIIYYCGPTKTPNSKIIGSSGPTTSSRMDVFTPGLLKRGLKGMIGKGMRSKEVIAAIKKYQAVYFLAFAGCGALLSKYVKKARVIAYRDLGSEAILKLEVENLPLIVGIDSKGRSIYKT